MPRPTRQDRAAAAVRKISAPVKESSRPVTIRRPTKPVYGREV